MLWLVRRSLVDAQRHAVCALHRAWILRDIQTTYCSPITQYTTRACYACACSATSNEQPAPPIVAPPPPQPLNIYQPAKPGTVKMYDYHFFIRNPTRMAGAVLDYLVLWPPAVERLPAFVELFKSIAKAQQMEPDLPVIKVTAFDDPTITPSAAAHDDSGHVDLLVYPDAVRYEQLPVHLLQLVFDAHMGLLETPREASPLTQYMVPMAYMQLFVCCHGARDARCGARGPPVVRRLMEVVREWGLEEQVEVFPCSHVGGHQYAGNVLVYCPASPCDGDWYGGITERNAHRFLKAVVYMEVDKEGGPSDPLLRSHWRGRMGLTPAGQRALFDNPPVISSQLSYYDEESDSEERGGDERGGVEGGEIPDHHHQRGTFDVKNVEDIDHVPDRNNEYHNDDYDDTHYNHNDGYHNDNKNLQLSAEDKEWAEFEGETLQGAELAAAEEELRAKLRQFRLQLTARYQQQQQQQQQQGGVVENRGEAMERVGDGGGGGLMRGRRRRR